jgi:hypothetical protein
MTLTPLVVYHAGCRDGFGAAWAAREVLPTAEFHQGFHGHPPPAAACVAGRDVYLLDFTYSRAEMVALALACRRLIVLDHHQTAHEPLDGLLEELQERGQRPAGDLIVLDMERSGAGITWDVLVQGAPTLCARCGGRRGHVAGCAEVLKRPRPWVIDYVEDRDLWRWALPDSRIVNAYIGAVPLEFEAWDRLLETPLAEARKAGEAVALKLRQYVAEVAQGAGVVTFAGLAWPCVNAANCDLSELLEHLMERHGAPVAMGWSWRGDGLYHYSLRSRGAIDVSAIARAHGGGGHRNAAGFQLEQALVLHAVLG